MSDINLSSYDLLHVCTSHVHVIVCTSSGVPTSQQDDELLDI